MPSLILRLVGYQDDADTLMTALRDVEGVEHLQQMADLPQLEEESDAPAEAVSHLHSIQLDVPDDASATQRVESIASDEARKLGISLEWIELEP